MNRDQLSNKSSFTYEEILAASLNKLIPDRHGGILPAPPMLMFDAISSIERKGARGAIVAQKKIRMDDWFFLCHFVNDPVQPGCLGLDAIWQLIGFFGSWSGDDGFGRALGCGEVEFFGQIRPFNKEVEYRVEIKRMQRYPDKNVSLIIGDGKVYVDGEHIYTIRNAKVGLFPGIDYPNYPFQHKNSRGGIIT